MTPADVDLLEVNEAFCSVVLNTIELLGVDPDRVNVQGGAVAYGHPIGASGARLLGTLVSQLRRRGGGIGVAAICSGAAQGDAMVLEVLPAMSEIRRSRSSAPGQMGSGIAQVAAVAGYDVTLVDVAPGQLERATVTIQASLTKLVEKGGWRRRTRTPRLTRIRTQLARRATPTC